MTPHEPLAPQLDLAFEEALPTRRIWPVSKLVAEVGKLVERKYGDVWVEGEISNLRPAPSGHLYFTLKDAFLWSRITKHHEYITVMGIALILILIRLYSKIFLAKESVADEKYLIAAGVIVVLALILERVFVSRLHITFFERLREKHVPQKKS